MCEELDCHRKGGAACQTIWGEGGAAERVYHIFVYIYIYIYIHTPFKGNSQVEIIVNWASERPCAMGSQFRPGRQAGVKW